MRAILLFIICVVLAAGAGFVAVLADEGLAASEPRATVGLALNRAGGGALLPIRLEPVRDPMANRFTLELGETVKTQAIETPPGVTLVPLDRAGATEAKRFRISLARSAAANEAVRVLVPISSIDAAGDARVTADGGLFSFLATDFGLDPHDYARARTGIVAAIGALVALMIIWVLSSVWMGVDGMRRKKAEGTATRLAERTADLERERDKLKQASKSGASADQRERDFWRDAVVGFLTNRNVEQAEIDRLLASIQVALRKEEETPEVEPAQPEAMPSLVARRD